MKDNGFFLLKIKLIYDNYYKNLFFEKLYRKEDLQHGAGIEIWGDGSKYEGSYFMGKKHGRG